MTVLSTLLAFLIRRRDFPGYDNKDGLEVKTITWVTHLQHL